MLPRFRPVPSVLIALPRGVSPKEHNTQQDKESQDAYDGFEHNPCFSTHAAKAYWKNSAVRHFFGTVRVQRSPQWQENVIGHVMVTVRFPAIRCFPTRPTRI